MNWKEIKNYENYQVSDCGRIRSNLRSKNKENYKEMKLQNKDGYKIIQLNNANSKTMFRVHRLVAEAFIEKIEGKDIINHIDGNKSNNLVSNLEWCTSSENNKHAFDTKLRENKKTYTTEDEIEIVRLKKEGFKIKEIKEFLSHVAMIAIQRICRKHNLINEKKNTSKYSIIEKRFIKKTLLESKEPLSTLCPKINIEKKLAGEIRRNVSWKEI